jgi:hypothetical protein
MLILLFSSRWIAVLELGSLSSGAIWMRDTGWVSQLAARALFVLFIIVPLMALLFDRKASLAWLAWTVLSLWAILNAVKLTTLVSPERHSPKHALGIILLAAANMVFSLALALLPTAWLSTFR